MRVYLDTVREVLEDGTRKENRTGVDTLSTFNINYEIDLAEGFPLLTTKKISWKNIVVENLWFLSGRTDIRLLQKHGCKFWDPWADAEGKVPSAYGRFWRAFPVPAGSAGENAGLNDQVRFVVDELQRNPMSRRMVISAWAPGNAQTSGLPPCHCLFILNVQNHPTLGRRLNLHLTQRSCDVALGVPYNIAGYALLLHCFARIAGLQPGVFAHTLVDAHIYTAKPDGSMQEHDHVPQLREQLTRTPRPLPRLHLHESIQTLEHIEQLIDADSSTLLQHFALEGYDPHPALKFKVAV